MMPLPLTCTSHFVQWKLVDENSIFSSSAHINTISCIILYITGQALCGNVRHIFISDRQETPYFDHLTDLFAFRLIRKQVSKQGWLRNQFPNQAGSKSVRQMASEDTDFAGITRHLTRSAKVPPTGIEPGPVRMPNGHATS